VEERCVVTAADAGYFPALMALLRSLKRTNPHLPVLVFDGGLSKIQAIKVGSFAKVLPKRPPFKIRGRGKFSYIGDTTLLKLEVGGLECEKVLYLDADMIVLERLDELFDFPEGSVGAVMEVNSVRNMFRSRHRDILFEMIDIGWDDPGFNAGLFALRPAEWRDLAEKAQSLVETFGEEVFSKSKDQQLLNVLFSGKVHVFPGRYNFSPFYDNIMTCKPAVVHYLSALKPWHTGYPEGCFYDEFRSNIRVSDHPRMAIVDIKRKLKKLKDLIGNEKS